MRLRSKREQLTVFAKNFFMHPAMLGSIIPSSAFLVRRVLGKVDWGRAQVVVEYGPGVGTITREILRRMRRDALLVAVEINPEFVRFLRSSIADPRLRVVQGSAADVRKFLAEQGRSRADYIIAGIPFSILKPAVRGEILQATREALQPDGALLVYQFSKKVLPDLRQTFPKVVRGFVPLNVLPAQLFFCYR